jgi:hypothetical protein
LRDRKRHDSEQPVIRLLEKQRGKRKRKNSPPAFAVRRVARAQIGIETKRGQRGAEAFQHDVGRD